MDTRKLKLLLALQENPLAPAQTLGKQIGVSAPTVRAWLEVLREERVFVGVHANIRARRIGLEMDDFMVQVNSFEALRKLEKFCEIHPYTSYRARVFGGESQGIMLQFREPDAAREHLLRAFDVMKTNGLIKNIRELPTLGVEYGSTFTRPRLDAWDSEKMVWNFDWIDWWNSCQEYRESIVDDRIIENEILSFDELDVRILQEIGTNARRKNIEIIEALGLDRDEPGIQQKISTRLKRLSDEVIADYRVYINWTYFDVYNTALIIANAKEETTNRLISCLGERKFPFNSVIRKIKTGFVWSARLPSAHLSELVTLVWDITNNYEVHLLDYKHSQVYGLWAEAFDSQKNKWRTDAELCFEKPLQEIGIKT